MQLIYFSELAEFAQSAAEIVYSDEFFISDLPGIPPAVEIKIGSYASSRFTHGIGALVMMDAMFETGQIWIREILHTNIDTYSFHT